MYDYWVALVWTKGHTQSRGDCQSLPGPGDGGLQQGGNKLSLNKLLCVTFLPHA